MLPTIDTLTIPNKPSMPGIMVHEFTHITFGATDDAYNCTLGYGDQNTGFFKQGVKLLKNQLPGANLRNADTYACWVEDSAVGWANAAPKIRGGR